MTERFEMELDMNITDNFTDKEYDLHTDEAFEFIELINKQNKENEQLKQPIKQILFSINSLIDKYAPNSDKMNILLELKEIILDDFGEEILE